MQTAQTEIEKRAFGETDGHQNDVCIAFDGRSNVQIWMCFMRQISRKWVVILGYAYIQFAILFPYAFGIALTFILLLFFANNNISSLRAHQKRMVSIFILHFKHLHCRLARTVMHKQIIIIMKRKLLSVNSILIAIHSFIVNLFLCVYDHR